MIWIKCFNFQYTYSLTIVDLSGEVQLENIETIIDIVAQLLKKVAQKLQKQNYESEVSKAIWLLSVKKM